MKFARQCFPIHTPESFLLIPHNRTRIVILAIDRGAGDVGARRSFTLRGKAWQVSQSYSLPCRLRVRIDARGPKHRELRQSNRSWAKPIALRPPQVPTLSERPKDLLDARNLHPRQTDTPQPHSGLWGADATQLCRPEKWIFRMQPLDDFTLFEMAEGALRRDVRPAPGSGPMASYERNLRGFGAAGRRGPDVDPELQRLVQFDAEKLSELPSFERMFQTSFGFQAVARVGNETRTLQAINHLSTEILAECLKHSGQLMPSDRVLLSALPSDRPMDSSPLIIVLTERVAKGSDGRVASGQLDLPLDLIQRTILSRRVPYQVPILEALTPAPEYQLLEAVRADPSALAQLFAIARPDVVYLPAVEMIELCAPYPGIRIERGNQVSTAGVLCRDQNGVLGITACYHGTGPAGTMVTIGQKQYTVERDDRVQDLVFIPIDDDVARCQLRALAGIRLEHDLVPAPHEKLSFDGATNRDSQTWVQSCDPWLFNNDPGVQLRLQTTRDTDHGDSGSALIDRNDKLVGFAFRMTGYGYRPEFSDWIWAPNALAALELTPIAGAP